MNEDKVYLVLMELKDVPAGFMFTKRSGQLRYRVLNHLMIFNSDILLNKRKDIDAREGYRLVQSDNQISSGCFGEFANDMMVHAHLTLKQLQQIEESKQVQETMGPKEEEEEEL